MIFPIPKISFSFFKCPITWTLLLINILVFVIFFASNKSGRLGMEEILDDEYFYRTQASIYKFYMDNNSQLYSDQQRNIVSYDSASKNKARVISSFALSDHKFVSNILDLEIEGDKIAIANWRSNFQKLLTMQKTAPNYQLGLLSSSSILNLVTYQFMHASFSHLFSNMLFLLLFGALLENLFGGLLLLLTYFASGVVAALVFLNFSIHVNSPLIGASGSVSGIIAAYCLGNFRNNIRFFYFLYIPKAEYMGFIYFPPWLLLIYWFLTDLTGYMSQVTEFAGVAYTAHIGGHAAGIVVALVTIFLWKKSDIKDTSKHRAGNAIPLSVFIRSKASAHSVLGDASRLHKLP